MNRQALLWVAIIALGVAIFAAGYSYRQLGNVRRESAHRLAELQQAVTTANDTANRADAEARAARQQAAVVEARLAEEQGQREALEQLYSDLSRGRDDAVLVEVERLITVAAQELQLSGNVATALAALQTADVRLSRSDNARFVPLRRVLARDIERLKAAPAVDFTGIALKLDQLASSVDTWPLLAAVTAAPASTAATADSSPTVERRRLVAAPVACAAERARGISRSDSHSPCRFSGVGAARRSTANVGAAAVALAAAERATSAAGAQRPALSRRPFRSTGPNGALFRYSIATGRRRAVADQTARVDGFVG